MTSVQTRSLAIVALTCAASPALAFVPWDNSDGEATSFFWSGGGSDHGLFGSPTVAGDTFTFFPRNFRAESINGVVDDDSLTSDRLEVELTAKPGKKFTKFRLSEAGDYGIVTLGTVSVSGSLFITNLDVFEVLDDEMETTPGSPITSGSGTWTGLAEVDVSTKVPPWTHVKLVLDNNLIAISLPGSITFIEKKVTGAGIIIDIIPTPGAAAVLALGGLAALRRRR